MDPYGSGGSHPNTSAYSYNPYQQYANGCQSTQGSSALRPPPLNTGHSIHAYSMNRTSSHGSSDSGYATRAPSVASPTPYQSYPVQSYPVTGYLVQSYPAQNYTHSRQPSQQSSSYSFNNQLSPEIEVVRAAPIPSTKSKKERRLSTPSPTSPSQYPCLSPNCGHISSRAHDLKRHMTVHFPPAVEELLDCKYEWCGRIGNHGFKREDHRKEHYRKVHMKGSEYPKMGKGGRSSKRERP